MAMQLIGRMLGFWQLVREVGVDDIQAEADQPFLIGVVAAEPARTAIVDALTEGAGPRGRQAVYAADPSWTETDEQALQRATVIVADASADETATIQRLDRLQHSPLATRPILLVLSAGAPSAIDLPEPGGAGPIWRETRVAQFTRPELQRYLLPAILKLVPHLALAIGRTLPAFRGAARQLIIGEVSRTNAKLAAFSNVPALIPVVGGLLAAAGDLVILTKNQIALLYKLAALHDRDLRQGARLILEVVPVVGAAFLWRTIARGLVSFLPFLAGAVPKVLIAYTGTFVVGQIAAFYYSTGQAPAQHQVTHWYRLAIEQVRHGLPLPGKP